MNNFVNYTIMYIDSALYQDLQATKNYSLNVFAMDTAYDFRGIMLLK